MVNYGSFTLLLVVIYFTSTLGIPYMPIKEASRRDGQLARDGMFISRLYKAYKKSLEDDDEAENQREVIAGLQQSPSSDDMEEFWRMYNSLYAQKRGGIQFGTALGHSSSSGGGHKSDYAKAHDAKFNELFGLGGKRELASDNEEGAGSSDEITQE